MKFYSRRKSCWDRKEVKVRPGSSYYHLTRRFRILSCQSDQDIVVIGGEDNDGYHASNLKLCVFTHVQHSFLQHHCFIQASFFSEAFPSVFIKVSLLMSAQLIFWIRFSQNYCLSLCSLSLTGYMCGVLIIICIASKLSMVIVGFLPLGA